MQYNDVLKVEVPDDEVPDPVPDDEVPVPDDNVPDRVAKPAPSGGSADIDVNEGDDSLGKDIWLAVHSAYSKCKQIMFDGRTVVPAHAGVTSSHLMTATIKNLRKLLYGVWPHAKTIR